MLKDVGMVVPKIKETRSTNYAYTTISDSCMRADKG